MDTIYLHDIELFVVVGCNPEEKIKRQKVVVSVTLEVNTVRAAESDDLNDTINYSEIYKNIKALEEGTNYNLIESFANRVATLCLSDKKVQAVTVTLQKPEAIKAVPHTGVCIRREQSCNEI